MRHRDYKQGLEELQFVGRSILIVQKRGLVFLTFPLPPISSMTAIGALPSAEDRSAKWFEAASRPILVGAATNGGTFLV